MSDGKTNSDGLNAFLSSEVDSARARHADLAKRMDELTKQWNDFLRSEGRLRPGESEEDRRRRTMQQRTIPSVRYHVG
jgi:hypothetical protein